MIIELFLFGLVLYIVWDIFIFTRIPDLTGKHVVVTGGSSGIGKAVSLEAARRGAHVTIVARDIKKLKETEKKLVDSCSASFSQKITILSMDVTQAYDLTENMVIDLEDSVGPIDLLVNCAGQAVCATLENDTEDNFRYMLNLNLLGTVLPTKAVAKRMARRKNGHIVITSSQGSLLGIYGMGAYCASKWALRGFAETLYQEMLVHNVTVTLCLPPDTDTPGFEQENVGKPEETKLICGGGGLSQPQEVAKKMLSDTLRGRFWSTSGVGNLLVASSAGMSPPSAWQEIIFQFTFASVMRVIGAGFGLYIRKVINSLQDKRNAMEANKKVQ